MDSQRFDEMTRSLASGSTRRTLLRGMLGGALAAVGLAGAARDGAAKGDKVDICHYDADSGTYHLINVSVNAQDAHLAHGDNSDIGCADGYALNLDTCECEAVATVFCPAGASIGDLCGGGIGECATNIDTGGAALVCADQVTFGGTGCSAPCTAGTCGAGRTCVVDGNCGGSQHCHPLILA